jgi:hypothetical protein
MRWRPAWPTTLTWWEWEKASKGRRQIAWSKWLREWADLGREQTDEEIADKELTGNYVLLLLPKTLARTPAAARPRVRASRARRAR